MIAGPESVFQITILFLYITAGAALASSRLPRFEDSSKLLLAVGVLFALTGLVWHLVILYAATVFPDGLALSLANTVSLVGLLIVTTALIGAFEPSLRGLSGGLLILGGIAAWMTDLSMAPPAPIATWQLQAHVLISILAYGLLAIGAIVALYALVQDNRLRSGKLGDANQLFAPLETNERLLYGIATAGFIALLIGVLSGFTFVENFFAQHLVHKSVLSILALVLFGVLIAGRHFAGWRGRRGVYLYLWGFAFLCLAYFGSRFVLENVLGRSWG